MMITNGSKVLVVASTGGHLAQALRWSERLALSADSHFLTFENEQSKSLLGGRRRSYVPYVAPRDFLGVMRTTIAVKGLLKSEPFDAVLSTGAAVALSAVAAAKQEGVAFHYIESLSRFDGPSLTGRILALVPGVHRFTQHPGYGPRWVRVDSLLSSYRIQSEPRSKQTSNGLRFFVTLGTIRPYRFDRMIDKVLSLLREGDSVVWQLGVSARADLPGESHESMTSVEFDLAIEQADVVVTHAGVGTLLRLVESGRVPLVAAREAKFGEHVDDHQRQALTEFLKFGIARDLLTSDRADVMASARESVEFDQ